MLSLDRRIIDLDEESQSFHECEAESEDLNLCVQEDDHALNLCVQEYDYTMNHWVQQTSTSDPWVVLVTAGLNKSHKTLKSFLEHLDDILYLNLSESDRKDDWRYGYPINLDISVAVITPEKIAEKPSKSLFQRFAALALTTTPNNHSSSSSTNRNGGSQDNSSSSGNGQTSSTSLSSIIKAPNSSSKRSHNNEESDEEGRENNNRQRKRGQYQPSKRKNSCPLYACILGKYLPTESPDCIFEQFHELSRFRVHMRKKHPVVHKRFNEHGISWQHMYEIYLEHYPQLLGVLEARPAYDEDLANRNWDMYGHLSRKYFVPQDKIRQSSIANDQSTTPQTASQIGPSEQLPTIPPAEADELVTNYDFEPLDGNSYGNNLDGEHSFVDIQGSGSAFLPQTHENIGPNMWDLFGAQIQNNHPLASPTQNVAIQNDHPLASPGIQDVQAQSSHTPAAPPRRFDENEYRLWVQYDPNNGGARAILPPPKLFKPRRDELDLEEWDDDSPPWERFDSWIRMAFQRDINFDWTTFKLEMKAHGGVYSINKSHDVKAVLSQHYDDPDANSRPKPVLILQRKLEGEELESDVP